MTNKCFSIYLFQTLIIDQCRGHHLHTSESCKFMFHGVFHRVFDVMHLRHVQQALGWINNIGLYIALQVVRYHQSSIYLTYVTVVWKITHKLLETSNVETSQYYFWAYYRWIWICTWLSAVSIICPPEN